MISMFGRRQGGTAGDWGKRLAANRPIFENAIGSSLPILGTFNVQLPIPIPINEHFRVSGAALVNFRDPKLPGEEEDFLFEVCRIFDELAFRVRPRHRITGGGGHGDQYIEIICPKDITSLAGYDQNKIKLSFFR